MSRKPSQSYQLTIRVKGPVADVLRDVAKAESVSLNQAVQLLLERAAGLDRRPGARIGKRLDRFVGLLSAEEGRSISETAQAAFGDVDPELWK